MKGNVIKAMRLNNIRSSSMRLQLQTGERERAATECPRVRGNVSTEKTRGIVMEIGSYQEEEKNR